MSCCSCFRQKSILHQPPSRCQWDCRRIWVMKSPFCAIRAKLLYGMLVSLGLFIVLASWRSSGIYRAKFSTNAVREGCGSIQARENVLRHGILSWSV